MKGTDISASPSVFWFCLRILILGVFALNVVLVRVGVLNDDSSGFGTQFYSNLSTWGILWHLILGAGIVLVFVGLHSRSSLPQEHWSRPSWNAPLFCARDPIPTIHFLGSATGTAFLVNIGVKLCRGEGVAAMDCYAVATTAGIISASRLVLWLWRERFVANK